jgi:hypothetical protein
MTIHFSFTFADLLDAAIITCTVVGSYIMARWISSTRP